MIIWRLKMCLDLILHDLRMHADLKWKKKCWWHNWLSL